MKGTAVIGALLTSGLIVGCGTTKKLYDGSDSATVRANTGIQYIGDQRINPAADKVVIAPGEHLIGVRGKWVRLTVSAGASYKISRATLHTVNRASVPRVVWIVEGGKGKPEYTICKSKKNCD